MTKYDFQKYVVNEEFDIANMIFNDCLEDGMTYNDWYEAVCKELELDKFSSSDEYDLNESIRDYVYKYIND